MKAAKKEKKTTVLKRPKCDFIPEKKKKKEERKVFEFDILVEMLVIDDKKSGKDFFELFWMPNFYPPPYSQNSLFVFLPRNFFWHFFFI